MNNTTRKYARSSMEAFPKTTEYACAVTRDDAPASKILRIVDNALLIGIAIIVLICVFLSNTPFSG